MIDDEFEWDDEKAARNLRLHGVSFGLAREVFDDPSAFDWLDTSENYGEERFEILGMSQNRLIQVAYTQRDGRTRIISARGAEPWEKRIYHEQKS